ncbi:aspartate racemase [Streptoalloteichus tenebrarius]|uniref:Aspartate racemase n=1 Tax=Streptoalloteichus tenebrarius (strain ATCC 17920 / DSM 40477 / JCM 4838 / CBS 697.72 / NBRC 16177 / NCIMB 11028 / NRRL B-12390 / A12253. 1 / ISP 5477) TaxID=1933 RepID=A0ABT1HWQ4_STRSD|nr:amino acid racemase [Streptoalloteichus tenebrarius]MCP2259951.1 aspartate racemase [Streptoalloteichus tenebrarius]BFF03276.1 aspartate/glutamate racemase family protein [Streptoalloteichus tenebrarius]
MRRIGLLGGMSWESTAVYYRLLNEGARERLGGLHSADLVLRSVDFADIAELQHASAWEALGATLAAEAAALVAAGAEVLGIATNTMHLVAPQIAAAAGIPLVHIVDVVGEAARARGVDRVAVLGTEFTMTSSLYTEGMARHGVEVVVPDAGDRRVVHDVIYDELCRGVVLDSSRRRYEEIVARLADRGARAVVLGCTEISLLLGQSEVEGVPVLDSTALHATALLDAALLDAALLDTAVPDPAPAARVAAPRLTPVPDPLAETRQERSA